MNDKSSDKDKVLKIIKENLYMTISVCEKNRPWIANLYYSYDKNFNFYWYSPKKSKHSKMIESNPNVALSIFDSTAIGDDVDAVYIQGKAYLITKKSELLHGMMAYGKKMLRTKFVNTKQAFKKFVSQYSDFNGNSPLRMYKAIPVKVWKLAPSDVYKNKYVDSRIEVDLTS